MLPALQLLVEIDAKQDRAAQAVQRLTPLVSAHPENAGLQLLLATAYLHSKNAADAEVHARKAIAIDSKTPDAHALLGRIDYARGSFDQAIRDFQSELDLTPSNRTSTYMALESLYEKTARWEDARRAAEAALSADPSSGAAANNLAYLYLEHGGDVNRAVSLAQQAKRADPDSPVAADTLGWALYKLGSPELALPQFRFSLQKFPNNPLYQAHIGMAYLSQGQFEPAERYLRSAIETDPNLSNDPGVRAALDRAAARSRR